MRRHLVLVGPRGAGKTTVGRALAARLGSPFADADALIETRAGKTIAAIFETQGEAHFRRLETAVLADWLAHPTPSVLATGGGVLLDRANRAAIAGAPAFVVYLHVDAQTALARLPAADPQRPALSGRPWAEELAALIAEREPQYRAAADLALDGTREPEASAEAILDALGDPS